MEHVLFVIIYAATLNSHKLFGLVSCESYWMTKTKGLCTDITIETAATVYSLNTVYVYMLVTLKLISGSTLQIHTQLKGILGFHIDVDLWRQ